MPSPQKENFVFNHNDLLTGVVYNIGIGGALDVVTGVTKRAPNWMQKMVLSGFIVLSRSLLECGIDISII